MLKSLCVLLFTVFITNSEGARKLESYNVDKSQITVSGISGGGAMAMQFHVAFSSEISGAGIFCGIPYSCGKDDINSAVNCLTNSGSVPEMVNEITTQSQLGQIDNFSNLTNSRVWIFHGIYDFVVHSDNAKHIKEIYDTFGSQVHTEFSHPAIHALPTDFYGGACHSTSIQGLINCNYKSVFHLLNYLHGGNLIEPDNTIDPAGEFFEFDQTEFAEGPISMGETGFLYVPTNCADRMTECTLNIAFHGCIYSIEDFDREIFTRNSGYNQAGEINNIIILFPQASPTPLINPNSCFEWWPYLNSDYLNKSGGQMKAIHAMIKRITGQDS